MKKNFLISAVLLFISSNLFSLEVYKSELEDATTNNTIEFINYAGPHKKIDSISAIKGIGSELGVIISKDVTKNTNIGNTEKYYVIHAVDSSESGKLDADILILGSNAGVDHIVNLRRIISAYLTAAYNYEEVDADALAVFITVYNAVYRGKIDIFQNKYKNIVLSNLTEEKCGLSINYEDWPGKTQIVIPLFDVTNGGLSIVDTSVISDKNVVGSMKEDDDKNIDSRKDMVDLKEREAEGAYEKAQEAQRKAAEEQRNLDAEKEKTLLAQALAEEADKEAKEAKKKAEENPNDKEAQKLAEEKEKEAAQKKTEAEKQEKAEKQQKEKTDVAKQEAEKQQKIADKKTSESQSERQEIAKDQKEVQDKLIEQANSPIEYGVILTDESKLFSKIVRFNSKNGKIVKASPVTVIRNRTVYKSNNSYVAIAGENKGKSAVKLVLLDSEKLEITAESEETIAEDSVLVQDGSNFYCVIEEGGKFFAALYDSELSLKVKSEIQVKKSTPITVSSNVIVVTDSTGALKALNKSTLKDVSVE